MGRWQTNWRIELRIMRSLRDGLSLQRADGKIDAGPGGLYERIAEADLGRHDRCHQRYRTRYRLRDDLKCVRSRIGHAQIPYAENQNRVHLLRSGVQFRYLDQGQISLE